MIESPCSCTDKINIMPKVICKFNVITIIKILMPLFTELKKETTQKICPEIEKNTNTQTISGRKEHC